VVELCEEEIYGEEFVRVLWGEVDMLEGGGLRLDVFRMNVSRMDVPGRDWKLGKRKAAQFCLATCWANEKRIDFNALKKTSRRTMYEQITTFISERILLMQHDSDFQQRARLRLSHLHIFAANTLKSGARFFSDFLTDFSYST